MKELMAESSFSKAVAKYITLHDRFIKHANEVKSRMTELHASAKLTTSYMLGSPSLKREMDFEEAEEEDIETSQEPAQKRVRMV